MPHTVRKGAGLGVDPRSVAQVTRAASVCGTFGCYLPATVDGRCDQHRRRGGSAWRRLRLAVLDRDRWRCQRCGRPASTVHHLDGLAQGGVELCHPSRLEARCPACNTRAGEGHTHPTTRHRKLAVMSGGRGRD